MKSLLLWMRLPPFLWQQRRQVIGHGLPLLIKFFYLHARFLAHTQWKLLKKSDNAFPPAGQSWQQNGPHEKKLLSKSLLKFFPHEVGQIRVLTLQKTHEYGPLIHGGAFCWMSSKKLHRTVFSFLHRLKKRGLAPKKIIIDHVHPSLEMSCPEKNFCHPLSFGDIDCTSQLAEFLPCPVELRAILPNGHTYWKLFSPP